jgi:hypothetical protein
MHRMYEVFNIHVIIVFWINQDKWDVINHVRTTRFAQFYWV